MLLYTSMPLEIVLEGIDEEHDFQEIDITGIKLVVEPMGINKAKIVRVISSDPQIFLNKKYSPGQVITFVSK
ncbi:MAG: YlzJ-like family protein [Tepidanaerobacteraceae bacterium]|nr:hypothetical protein [Thermoanaerobacterales bacterium]